MVDGFAVPTFFAHQSINRRSPIHTLVYYCLAPLLMSSRSTSSFSPLDAKSEASAALSKDALYAPLSSYTSKPNHQHSLTLQTSSSLRESSLLTFLTNTCQHLKTSHPYECALYRGIGGSLTKHGMGDNENANDISKTFFEGKLSNRSLVLVGGGIHSHVSREEDGDTSMIQSAVAKKRERKRVGGNGMFGSLSKRKRKTILKRIRLDFDSDANLQGENESENIANTSMDNVIETIHDMWRKYISQLVFHIRPNASKNVKSSVHDGPMTPQLRQKLALLLLEAEHVGMAVTIIECPSRCDLIQHRCVVVNETVNTWSLAMRTRSKRNNKRTLDASVVDVKTAGRAIDVDDNVDTPRTSLTRTWKIIMIPKHRTVLETSIPLSESFQPQTISHISIRLET